MTWTSPRTWVTGETVSASIMNQHVRDNLKAIGDPWVAYTPTWAAATTNPALGNGSLQAAYIAAGKLIFVRMVLVPGSTTTFGAGTYNFSLPFTASSVIQATPGIAHLIGTDRWGGQVTINPSNTTFNVYLPASATNPRLAAMDKSTPETFANGSSLRTFLTYEAA